MLEYKHDSATFHIDSATEARIKIAYHGETGYIKVNLLELIGSPQEWPPKSKGKESDVADRLKPFDDLNAEIKEVCDELKDKVELKAKAEREKAKAAKSKSKAGKGKGGGGFSLGSIMKK